MEKGKKGNKEKVDKKKLEEAKNGKRKLMGIVAILIIIFAGFIYMNSKENKYVLKSEYSVNELGYIDDIEITLIDVSYINSGSAVELSFKITNRRDNTITIIPDDYFVFYDINQVQIPNKFSNDKNIVKKDETIVYKLQYDVTKKELYEIYFYSQVVENNIKFSFKSGDISIIGIKENDITLEDSIEE